MFSFIAGRANPAIRCEAGWPPRNPSSATHAITTPITLRTVDEARISNSSPTTSRMTAMIPIGVSVRPFIVGGA